MRYLAVIAFLVFYGKALAQQDAKAKTSRICRILFVNKPAKAPSKVFMHDGVESREIVLPTLNMSEELKLPPGEINIRITPNALVEDQPFPSGAPRVKIPETYGDIYLLLFGDTQNKVLPFKIRVINIAGVNLKNGQTLWINTTKFDISARTGKTKFIAPANKLKVVEAPLDKHGFYLAEFFYRSSPQARFLPVMKNNWWFDANSRHLGIVLDNGAKMPRIYTLRDRRLPKPPEGEGGTSPAPSE